MHQIKCFVTVMISIRQRLYFLILLTNNILNKPYKASNNQVIIQSSCFRSLYQSKKHAVTKNDRHKVQERVTSYIIAVIGIATLDMIMVMEGFNGHEGSFHCDKLITEGGGMAATALCTASKLGSPTRLFSRIGDDVHGQFILDGLKRYGVDTCGTVSLEGRSTTVAIVITDSITGEKQFFSGRIKPAFIDPVQLDTSLLEGADVLLVDGHWIEGSLTGCKWAQSHGIPVVADFKCMYPGVESLLPYIGYFIIPSFFAEEMTGEKTTRRILKKLTSLQAGVPVITCGSKGGAYLSNGEVTTYRAFPITCVDSTGAGDAFHGAFCHFLSLGVNIGRCLELSSAVGALNCRAIGGRTALPSRDELRQFLRENGANPEFP